jgi:hypothetical protein
VRVRGALVIVAAGCPSAAVAKIASASKGANRIHARADAQEAIVSAGDTIVHISTRSTVSGETRIALARKRPDGIRTRCIIVA